MHRSILVSLLFVFACLALSSKAESGLTFSRCSVPKSNAYISTNISIPDSPQFVAFLSNTTDTSINVYVICTDDSFNTTMVAANATVDRYAATLIKFSWTVAIQERINGTFTCRLYPRNPTLGVGVPVFGFFTVFTSYCELSAVPLPPGTTGFVVKPVSPYSMNFMSCNRTNGQVTFRVGLEVSEDAFFTLQYQRSISMLTSFFNLNSNAQILDRLTNQTALTSTITIPANLTNSDVPDFTIPYTSDVSFNLRTTLPVSSSAVFTAVVRVGTRAENWLLASYNFVCTNSRKRNINSQEFVGGVGLTLSKIPRATCTANPATPGYSTLTLDFTITSGMVNTVFFVKTEDLQTGLSDTVYAGLADSLPFKDSMVIPVKTGKRHILYFEQEGHETSRFPVKC